MHLDFCKIDMRFHINGGDLMDRKIPNFDFDFSPIGQAIKESRTARKLTREQLAEESNYSDRHITSIENEGQFPSAELLFWLAQKFELSLDQYVFPDKNIGKTTARRQADAKLNELNDRELRIISNLADNLIALREPEE